jgi:hypothetical protein
MIAPPRGTIADERIRRLSPSFFTEREKEVAFIRNF